MKLSNEYLVNLLYRTREGMDADSELKYEVFEIIEDILTELLTYRVDEYGRMVDTAGMTMIANGDGITLPYTQVSRA